jgi:hypothetical protein
LPSLSDHRQGSHHRCVRSGDIHPSPLPHRYPAHGRAGAPRAAVPRAPGHYYTTGHDSCRLDGRARAGLAEDTIAAEAVRWSADRAQGAYSSAGSDAPPQPRAGPLGAARGEHRRARPSAAGREENTPCDGADRSGLGRYGVREPWAVSWAGAPALTSGAERLINAGWALLLVTAQVGGDRGKGVRDVVFL